MSQVAKGLIDQLLAQWAEFLHIDSPNHQQSAWLCLVPLFFLSSVFCQEISSHHYCCLLLPQRWLLWPPKPCCFLGYSHPLEALPNAGAHTTSVAVPLTLSHTLS